MKFDGRFQILRTFDVSNDLNAKDMAGLFQKEKKAILDELNQFSSKRVIDEPKKQNAETSYLNHYIFSISDGGNIRSGNEVNKHFFVNCSKGFYDGLELEGKGVFSRIRDFKCELLYKT